MSELKQAIQKGLAMLSPLSPSSVNDTARDLAAHMEGWDNDDRLPPSQLVPLRENLAHALQAGYSEPCLRALLHALFYELSAVGKGYGLALGAPAPRTEASFCLTLALVCDEQCDHHEGILPDSPQWGHSGAQVLVIGNGFDMEGRLPPGDLQYVYLPHKLGYAQLFSFLEILCDGSSILYSDNGTFPKPEQARQLLDWLEREPGSFLTALDSTGLWDDSDVPVAYHDLCPPWGFQAFSRSVFSSTARPDPRLQFLEHLVHGFVLALGQQGIKTKTVAIPLATVAPSCLLNAHKARLEDRRTFMKFYHQAPPKRVDPVLIVSLLHALGSNLRSVLLVTEESATVEETLRSLLSQRSGGALCPFTRGSAEPMSDFSARLEEHLGNAQYDLIAFVLPASFFNDFEALLLRAANAVRGGGSIWYYDNNLFYIENLPTLLADLAFQEKPLQYQYSVYFRKRLRDVMARQGFDLQFQRYRPCLPGAFEEQATQVIACFDAHSEEMRANLSTQYFLCSAKRGE